MDSVSLSPGGQVASGRGQSLPRYLPVAVYSATNPISQFGTLEGLQIKTVSQRTRILRKRKKTRSGKQQNNLRVIGLRPHP
jgi:hypothetical protein